MTSPSRPSRRPGRDRERWPSSASEENDRSGIGNTACRVSQENVEIVRRGFEHFRATAGPLPEILAPDFVWDCPPSGAGPRSRPTRAPRGRGSSCRTGCRRSRTGTSSSKASTTPGTKWSPSADRAAARGCTGVRADTLLAQVFHVARRPPRRGWRRSVDPAEALNAVGLEERRVSGERGDRQASDRGVQPTRRRWVCAYHDPRLRLDHIDGGRRGRGLLGTRGHRHRNFGTHERAWDEFLALADDYRDLGDRVLFEGRLQGAAPAAAFRSPRSWTSSTTFAAGTRRCTRSRSRRGLAGGRARGVGAVDSVSLALPGLEYRRAILADAPEIADLHARKLAGALPGRLCGWAPTTCSRRPHVGMGRAARVRRGPASARWWHSPARGSSASPTPTSARMRRWGALLENLHVAVPASPRGRTELMSRTAGIVLERAPAQGLHLWVLEQNTAAQAFYRGLGGSCVERSPGPPSGRRPRAAQLGSPWRFRFAWRNPAVRASNAP